MKLQVPSRYIEIPIWYLLALLVLLPTLITIVRVPSWRWIDILVDEYYNQVLISVFLMLFPMLFKQIFGQRPFEYIRNRRNSPKNISVENSENVTIFLEERVKSESKSNNIEYFIYESKIIAERIFLRSGVYLLFGCLIAFTGVAMFSSPLFPTATSTDFTQRILEYSPRFGALFFIESIAFFFLKQYRIMLEEYRYYEAIKRKRQDNFVLVELIEKHKDNPELYKTLADKVTQSTITKLANGETTEVLETQKIVNQDMDIFSKLIDLIKEIKSR